MASGLARKEESARAGGALLPGGRVHPDAERGIWRARGRGRPLDVPSRKRLAPIIGDSLDDVRVHDDPLADTLARSVSARAFTTGTDVFFGRGEYRPGTSRGDALLAHELVHVAQQRRAPTSGPLRVTQPGDPLEAHAEAAAADLTGSQATPASTGVPLGGGPVPLSRVLARAIGYEYETNEIRTARAVFKNPKERKAFNQASGKEGDTFPAVLQEPVIQARDHAGTGQLVPIMETKTHWFRKDEQVARHFSYTSLKKKDEVAVAEGFKLEADEVDAPGPQGAGSNLEFVTDPFEETPDGLSKASAALMRMQELCQTLHAKREAKHVYVKATELTNNAPDDVVLFFISDPDKKVKEIEGALQVTAAVMLHRVSRLLDQMGTPKDDQAPIAQLTAARKFFAGPHKDQVGGGDGGAKESAAYSGPKWARAALAEHARFGAQGHSRRLESLVALMTNYIWNGASLALGYAKTMAPLMARTDFAEMFRSLPKKERDYLSAGKGVEFVKLVMAAAAKGVKAKGFYKREVLLADSPMTADEPMIPFGLYSTLRDRPANEHELRDLTRERWIIGISQGIDYLTAEDYNKNPDLKLTAEEAEKEKKALESMGALKSHRDFAGPKGDRKAPRFEFRGLGRFSSLKLYAIAMDMFGFLAALTRDETTLATEHRGPDLGASNNPDADTEQFKKDTEKRIKKILKGK